MQQNSTLRCIIEANEQLQGFILQYKSSKSFSISHKVEHLIQIITDTQSFHREFFTFFHNIF